MPVIGVGIDVVDIDRFVQSLERTPSLRARLFTDAGEIGVNIEDLRIDHDPGRDYGLVELSIATESVDHLLDSLGERGWTAHR